MKVLFLDIDGVANCKTTGQRHNGLIGIDPYMALLIARIVESTDTKIVLSSSWRYSTEGREHVKKAVYPFIDITPLGRNIDETRGHEIKRWLEAHPEVTKYAILDDDSDMLEEQLPNFFQTSWDNGLTDEIAEKVTKHLL